MIRVATRGSQQALTQAGHVARMIESTGHATELVVVDTTGDRTQAANVPLHSIGGQGVFVKEVQVAVLEGRADVAVHSAKDLPTTPTEGLTIGAFTERRSAHDALVGRALHDLPAGATIATGSVRRRAQLSRARPDLRFVELRGNIATRLDRVPDGGAIVMAVAALEVLGLTDRIAEVLDLTEFVPAVGQGCVAVECRTDDDAVGRALLAIDHDRTRHDVLVERAFLSELGSGCSLPIGAHATDGVLHVFLAGESGAVVSESVALDGDPAAADGIARRAANAARDRVANGR